MNHSRLKSVCAVLCLLLAFGVTGAEAASTTLDEVLVTARGVPAPASQTPGGIGVVTDEDIRESGAVSVADALARIPGVTKTGDSPWGAEINIRGLGRDQVVVLIDGVRVNTTTDINGRLGVINQADIARVEVLKGPISALYGSGSIGGVVNIITKKGRFTEKPEWHGEGSLTASSNPLGPDAYANLSYSSDSFWMLGSGGWRKAGSYYDGRGEKTHNSRFEDWQGKLAGAFKWGDEHSTMLQYQHMEGSDIGVPGGNSKGLPTNADVTLRDNDRKMLQVVHTWTPKGMALTESELDLSWQYLVRSPLLNNYSGAGNPAWRVPTGTHETLAGKWKNVFKLDSHTVVAGTEVWNWDMRSRTMTMSTAGVTTYASSVPDASQLTSGVFAEDDWKLAPAWTLNLGGRADSVHITNQGGTAISGSGGEKNDANWGAHAGLTYAFSDPWSASLLAATSYRTPNILELYKNIPYSGLTEKGDPNLKAEESRFVELSIKRQGESLRLTSALYANYIRNYITKQFTAATVLTMTNIKAAELYGAEQSVEWDFASGWTAYANAAYTQGRDETHATWLPFVAPLSGLVGVKQTIGAWWWAVESQWAADQNNTPSGTKDGQSWATMNARAGYKMDAAGLKHEFTLGVNNLFNASYTNYLTTARGNVYREPGTNAYMNYHVSF
jgi:hemoglobin/transferrin/lactoferrin receptor protein